MDCQLCKKKAATIKIAQVINNQKIEINLCKSCAEKKGLEDPMVTLPQIFGSFVADLIGEGESGPGIEQGLACPGCGLTWAAFERTGLFGCDICYKTFDRNLGVVLRRIHGSTQHIGSRPKSQRKAVDKKELERIQHELAEAIQDEDFEKAAELRDLMRDAQRETVHRENDGILR